MQHLNLPPYPARISKQGEMVVIYDFLRHRYVRLTPEEWVRQHFTHFLVEGLGYPAALMGNEMSLCVGGVMRRADTVVYHRMGGTPRVIVEYKAPNVGITQNVFQQIYAYNSVLRADYLMVSNGLEHYCCHIDYATRSVEYLPQIPRYDELRERAEK